MIMASRIALLSFVVCLGAALMAKVAVASPPEVIEETENSEMSEMCEIPMSEMLELEIAAEPHKQMGLGDDEDEKDQSTTEASSSTIDGTLLFSFMVLRALAAGQSVNPESNRLMWIGIAVAAVSRTFYEGRDPLTNPSVLLVSSFKELSHVCGLSFVLQSFSTSSNETSEAAE